MSDEELIERLTAERDKAREEAGVYKYRMENYNAEMYRYLHKVMEQDKLLEEAWEEGSRAGWKPGSIGYKMHRENLTNPYRKDRT